MRMSSKDLRKDAAEATKPDILHVQQKLVQTPIQRLSLTPPIAFGAFAFHTPRIVAAVVGHLNDVLELSLPFPVVEDIPVAIVWLVSRER
jgi:hypothetical protein